MLLLTIAWAQDFNAQQFRPSVDSQHTVWTDDTGSGPDGLHFRALAGYANSPLVFEPADGEPRDAVANLTQVHLAGAISRGRFRLGAQAPITAYATGDSVEGPAGLGDVTLHGRLRLVDHVALGGVLIAPTNTQAAPLGASKVGGELTLIADAPLGERLFLAANAGIRLGSEVELGTETWNDPLVGRLGIGMAVNDATNVSLEVASTWDPGIPAHAEVLLAGSRRIGDHLGLRVGVGRGIANGPGSPDVRVIAGLSYDPALEEVALTTVSTRLVNPDGDAVVGAQVSLSGPTRAKGQSSDTFQVESGEYEVTVEAEGYEPIGTVVRIPQEANHTIELTLSPKATMGTLRLDVTDPDGNAVAATWHTDVLANPTPVEPGNAFEIMPGEHRIVVAAEGYGSTVLTTTIQGGQEQVLEVMMQPALVELVGDRVEIREKVFFELDSAAIKGESHELLNQVAALMLEHPELVLVRIEGHTDSQGGELHNLELSKARAEAVRDYLVGAGVAADRLSAAGYGETRPLVEGDSDEVHAQNRRVEFHVEERSD